MIGGGSAKKCGQAKKFLIWRLVSCCRSKKAFMWVIVKSCCSPWCDLTCCTHAHVHLALPLSRCTYKTSFPKFRSNSNVTLISESNILCNNNTHTHLYVFFLSVFQQKFPHNMKTPLQFVLLATSKRTPVQLVPLSHANIFQAQQQLLCATVTHYCNCLLIIKQLGSCLSEILLGLNWLDKCDHPTSINKSCRKKRLGSVEFTDLRLSR